MRDIRARNQQHHGDGELQQQDEAAHITDDFLVQRLHVDAQPGVGLRISQRQRAHHRPELLLRGLARDAGGKPPDHEQQVRIAHGREIAAERKRPRNAAIAAQPDIDIAQDGRLERRRHDAGHFVAAPVEDDRLAEDGGGLSEPADPEPVAQDRHARRARLVV